MKAPTAPDKDSLILANMEQLMRMVIEIKDKLNKLMKHLGSHEKSK